MLQCLAFESLCLGGVGREGLVGRAVFHIDGVNVVNKLHDLVVVHEIGQPAAELGREVIFAVGKRTRAAEAAHGVANAAMDAFLDLACNNGAMPRIDISALVENADLKLGMTGNKLVTGKNTGRAASDYRNVVV